MSTGIRAVLAPLLASAVILSCGTTSQANSVDSNTSLVSLPSNTTAAPEKLPTSTTTSAVQVPENTPTTTTEPEKLPTSTTTGAVQVPESTPTTTREPERLPTSDCYLSSDRDAGVTGWEPALSLSHKRPGYRLKSTGTIEIVVLFAEFQDVIARETTQSIFSIISPDAEEFINDQSYGRLQLSFRPHHSWLQLRSNASVYASAIKTYEGHRNFMQEAVDLADNKVDFRGADAVLVIATPNAREIGYGPAWMGQPSDPITADGQVITNGVTSGADLLHWRDGWYPHELGHSLGLPDLYGASIPGRGGWTRPFSLMDLISGSAPGYMGYSRWILQWLDDSQVHCIQNDITLELTPLALKEGSKLAIVPLTPSTALVAEVRQAIGYDAGLTREGVVVYAVDTNNNGRNGGSYGAGPMEVLNDANALRMGESVTHSGITFKVLPSETDRELLQITFENATP